MSFMKHRIGGGGGVVLLLHLSERLLREARAESEARLARRSTVCPPLWLLHPRPLLK
jgi:hypothetical protein